MYRAGSRQQVEFDDTDWWGRIAGCCPTGGEQVPYIGLAEMPSDYIFILGVCKT
jgi:hypothetical protein